MKWKCFVLLALCVSLVGCATAPRTHESLMQNPVYRSATPDNRERILAKKIGVGMSIPECKLSWCGDDEQKIGRTFRCLRRDSLGNELWRTPAYGVSSFGVLYLHVEKGGIVYIAEHPER